MDHDHAVSSNTHLVIVMPPIMHHGQSTPAHMAPKGSYNRPVITDSRLNAALGVVTELELLVGLNVRSHRMRRAASCVNSGLFPELYEKMTSSTKPEVHNVLHRRPRKTEPLQSDVTCIENFMKLFGLVVFDHASVQTNRQRNK